MLESLQYIVNRPFYIYNYLKFRLKDLGSLLKVASFFGKLDIFHPLRDVNIYCIIDKKNSWLTLHWNLQENEAPVRTSNDGETSSDSEDDLDDDDFNPDKETTVYMAGNRK